MKIYPIVVLVYICMFGEQVQVYTYLHGVHFRSDNFSLIVNFHLINRMTQVSFKHLTSYFKGQIYTNGAVQADCAIQRFSQKLLSQLIPAVCTSAMHL